MAQPSPPSDRRPAGVSISLMPAAGVSEAELTQITEIFADLVSAGAALGWVDPPDREQVSALLANVAEGITAGESSVALAVQSDDGRPGCDGTGERIVGIAYWRRYTRPTHRPHVDIEKVAVDPRDHGGGIGRGLMQALITSAREAGVEVITLDLRGDNVRAIRLYESLGFTRYGLLPGFVAVGQQRFDTHLYALDLRVT
ncbi:GNAT family N-acetyltransferase [Brevibacterium oceani]|uniref:GNAT family N-acetyltransferase n=1 Tax=Brevibacterium oceani TaxID=358099 RepID=UPI001C62B4BF|nr:GNAT family N-acetyltransferase [Brevibacterium oceani]